MYGHGFSDKPRLRCTRDLFARRLSELLAAVAPGARLHLVGWSMGAMVATSFALAQRNTAGSLFMVSPSGLPVEVVWARQDEATPFANSATFAQRVPQAGITPLEGVGHAIQFEAPDLVAASLLPWLAWHCAR
jgi:pimeloyl-ACP methyl ester carboxylesterase